MWIAIYILSMIGCGWLAHRSLKHAGFDELLEVGVFTVSAFIPVLNTMVFLSCIFTVLGERMGEKVPG